MLRPQSRPYPPDPRAPCVLASHPPIRPPSTKRHRKVNPEDRNIDLITHWLTGQIDDDAIRTSLSSEGLEGEGAEAVEELMTELGRSDASRGHLQMVARETLEALALG